MSIVERYREQAKWARANSEIAPTPERQRWLDVARQYETLAVEHGKGRPTRTEAAVMNKNRMPMAARVGDTVDIYWCDTGRSDSGTVEKVFGITVTLRIAGPPQITMMVSADQLVAADQHHWRLDT